jgi:hypothetical protein
LTSNKYAPFPFDLTPELSTPGPLAFIRDRNDNLYEEN